MFGVNNVDDFVELHAFKTFERLFEIERDTKFLEHGDIRPGTDDLTVDQRTVAVEKYRINLRHAFPFLNKFNVYVPHYVETQSLPYKQIQ